MTRITLLLVLCSLQVQPAMAQALQGVKKGDLESNLSVLNLFGRQPEMVQQMYRSAYGVLSANREATFMDVSRDTDFQCICKKNGFTHLGGPLLGSVTSDGASVWIRTLKPGKVEVQDIDFPKLEPGAGNRLWVLKKRFLAPRSFLT